VTTFSAGGNKSIVLFHINGPLTISVRGFSDFSVPIAIFFDPPFPRALPRIFVTAPPGADLEIVPNHPFVEPSGLVKLPAAWDPRRPGYLPGILVSAMSSDCPVSPPAGAVDRVLEESMAAALDSIHGRIALAETRKQKLVDREICLKDHESNLRTKSENLAKKNIFLSGLNFGEEIEPLTTLKFSGKYLAETAADKIAEIAALEDYAGILENFLRKGEISVSDFLPEFRSNSAKIFEAREISSRAIAALHLKA